MRAMAATRGECREQPLDNPIQHQVGTHVCSVTYESALTMEKMASHGDKDENSYIVEIADVGRLTRKLPASAAHRMSRLGREWT